VNSIKTLSIIIITFNSENQIIKCLESIFASNLTKNLNINITVIDNCSLDNTVRIITEKFDRQVKDKKLKLIQNSKNVGFSKAVNQGIKNSKSDFYLLINPDVFVNRDTIKNVFSTSLIENFSITGVHMINVQGVENGSYFRFPNVYVGIFEFTNFGKFLTLNKWHNYFYYKDSEIKSGIVDVVTGGFMLIDHRVIDKVGYFDERYFMYLEDVDYCLEAKKRGFKVGVSHDVVTHIAGASSNNIEKTDINAWLESRRKYFKKNFNIFVNLLIQPIFVFDAVVIYIIRFIKTIRQNYRK